MSKRSIDQLPEPPEVERPSSRLVPVMTSLRLNAYYDPDCAWFDDSPADPEPVEGEPARSVADRPVEPVLVTV